MSPQELTQGGVVGGVVVDPVTLLFHALQTRFAPLGEETRLAALTSFMSFHRKPHGRINELLTRFEASQNRAINEAGFRMSYEGLSYMLLRAVGPTESQLLQILQPFNANCPSTQAELTQMLAALRRMGHILEN